MKESLEIGIENLYPHEHLIDFPKRPPWTAQDTKETLEAREEHYFQDWLQNVYKSYDLKNLSYFEHNIEVWRQLWRVLEISYV
jgi:hypothetical protein